MDEELKALGDAIAAASPGVVTRAYVEFGELNLCVEASRIVQALKDTAAIFYRMYILRWYDRPIGRNTA